MSGLKQDETYRLLISLPSGKLQEHDALDVTLTGGGIDARTKRLHSGDPDYYLTFRPMKDAAGSLALSVPNNSGAVPVRLEWSRLDLDESERPALETEPNDDPGHANPLIIGRDVYGSADDVDYLENPDEGRTGLDWFRLDFNSDQPGSSISSST